MAVPEGDVQPGVSERKAVPCAAVLGRTGPDEMLSVAVRVRPPDMPPLPTAGSWAAVLLAKEPSQAAAFISIANGRLFGVSA